MPSALERRQAVETNVRRGLKAADGFDADDRASKREQLPVKIGGVTFGRRRKDWRVSRLMRQVMRDQEKAVALSQRLGTRVAELHAKQTEAVIDDDVEEEQKLEQRIDDLLRATDDATEQAESVSYELLALLLIPPADGYGEHNTQLVGFGPEGRENEAELAEAIAWLQADDRLDVQDVAALVQDLTGSGEADAQDPPPTPSSANGST